MTEKNLHKYSDTVIKELYDRNSYHEISEADLQAELLKGLSPEEKNIIIRFLLSDSRTCKRDVRAAQFKTQGNISIITLSDIGLDVIIKHKGSHSEYLKSIAKKESREKWVYIWAIIAGVTGLLGLVQSDIRDYVRHRMDEPPEDKTKTKSEERTPKKEEVEYPRNQIDVNGSKSDSALEPSLKALERLESTEGFSNTEERTQLAPTIAI